MPAGLGLSVPRATPRPWPAPAWSVPPGPGLPDPPPRDGLAASRSAITLRMSPSGAPSGTACAASRTCPALPAPVPTSSRESGNWPPAGMSVPYPTLLLISSSSSFSVTRSDFANVPASFSMDFTVRSIWPRAIFAISLTTAPSWAAVSCVLNKVTACMSPSPIGAAGRPRRQRIIYSTLGAAASFSSSKRTGGSVSPRWLSAAIPWRAAAYSAALSSTRFPTMAWSRRENPVPSTSPKWFSRLSSTASSYSGRYAQVKKGWLYGVCRVSERSNTYFSPSCGPVSSRRAMPTAPGLTQRR